MRLMGEKKKRMRAPTCACSGIPITVPALNWLASVSLRIYGSPRAGRQRQMRCSETACNRQQVKMGILHDGQAASSELDATSSMKLGFTRSSS